MSHGTSTTSGAITQHAARRSLLGMAEGIYLVPRAIAARRSAVRSRRERSTARASRDGRAAPPGEDYPLGKHRWVRPFETFHRVPSQGYTVWERRAGCGTSSGASPATRLGELRRDGAAIDESHEVALLSFTGDTRVEVLERTAELARTETLVIEASSWTSVSPSRTPARWATSTSTS